MAGPFFVVALVCVVLALGGREKELSGAEAATTNNRMELTAVIRALEQLKEPCRVELWSDSKYVTDALSLGWARGWQAKGWKKPDKKPALNPELWQRLLELTEVHTVSCHWVRGHADNPSGQPRFLAERLQLGGLPVDLLRRPGQLRHRLPPHR